MPKVLTIDPGTRGGAIYYDDCGGFESFSYQGFQKIPRFLDIDVCVMEKLWGTASRLPKVQANLFRSMGHWEGAFPEQEWIYVTPQEWQKDLHIKADSYGERKKKLHALAQDELQPAWNMRMTHKISDAALLMRWYLDSLDINWAP